MGWKGDENMGIRRENSNQVVKRQYEGLTVLQCKMAKILLRVSGKEAADEFVKFCHERNKRGNHENKQ